MHHRVNPGGSGCIGGQPIVSFASRIARSAYKIGETTPILVVAPVVTMDIGVTSEPVPAVVGI